MQSTSIKGFRIVYPGVTKTLKSIINIGFGQITTETVNNFGEPVLAVWDTGATRSCINETFALKYKLPISGMTICRGVNSQQQVNTYVVSLVLPNNNYVNDIEICSCDSTFPYGMLIGMDIISKGEFMVCTHNNITVYSFQNPAISLLSFDYILNRPQLGISVNDDFNVDMLCPCGSKLSFKKCCAK